MSQLSTQLTCYYQKQGNRILFSNKLTLNKLALEMWQRLDFHGMDASVLSRVLKGKRLFTTKQLQVFCELLSLNKSEVSKLYQALERDYLNRYGLSLTSPIPSLDFTNILSWQVKKIHQARETGQLALTLQWSEELIDFLDKLARSDNRLSVKEKLSSLLGDLLYEQGFASGCIYLPQKNLLTISPIVKRMLEIAKTVRSPLLAAKAYVILGFAHYSFGKYSFARKYHNFYQQSLNVTKKALATDTISDEIKLICYRYLALNSTYLQDRSLFTSAQNSIRDTIHRQSHKGYFSYTPRALDSIARGQAYFGLGNPLKTLEESKLYEQKISWRDPLREAASIRNELEILKKLRIKNTAHISKHVARGLFLSQEYNIHRYTQYFKNFSLSN